MFFNPRFEVVVVNRGVVAAQLLELGLHPAPVFKHDAGRLGEVWWRSIAVEGDIGRSRDKIVYPVPELFVRVNHAQVIQSCQ